MKKTIILAVLAIVSIGGLVFVKVQADQKNARESQVKATNDYMKCREKFVSAVDTNSSIKDINFNTLDKPTIENDFKEYGPELSAVKTAATDYTKCIENSNINVLNDNSKIDEAARKTVYDSAQKEMEMANKYINASESFLSKKDEYINLIENVNKENYIGIITELVSYLGKSIDEVKSLVPNNPSEIADKITGLSKDFVNTTKEKIDYYTKSNQELENALNSIINS